MTIAFLAQEADAGLRLSLFLRRRGMSAALIKRCKYREDGLALNGTRARTNAVVCRGDRIEVRLPPEEVCSVPPEEIPLCIVYESPHAMVVEKPAGLVMHPTLSHSGGTLANAFSSLMLSRGKPATFRPQGRLDADTSGLVLLAMNAFAAPQLGHTMQKEYIALAGGPMPLGPGCIDAPLAPCVDSLIRQQVVLGGRASATDYEVLASTAAASLVRVMPRTGRTHQIRAHFAHVGHPLLGDALYGGNTALLARHALHCAKLRFKEPQGAAHTFKSALPEDMVAAAQVAGLPVNHDKTMNSARQGCQKPTENV